jgi:hypothetical protein
MRGGEFQGFVFPPVGAYLIFRNKDKGLQEKVETFSKGYYSLPTIIKSNVDISSGANNLGNQ